MDSYSLPFYASQDILPVDLPSTTAILESTEVFIKQTARNVVGVGDHFVAKYGMAIDLEEGQIMQYIAHSTNVKVPKIYALYKDDQDRKYIVMERIHGSTLSQVWHGLSTAEKTSIADQLKHFFEKLRELPSPKGYCGFASGPLKDSLFYGGDTTTFPNPDGPFDTEAELNRALIHNFETGGSLSEHKVSFWLRSLSSVLKDHAPTFTHADLQRKNIILQQNGDGIVIIDWEVAGWYPSYWEYARAMYSCGRFEDDWSEWIDYCLQRYSQEYAWMLIMLFQAWG